MVNNASSSNPQSPIVNNYYGGYPPKDTYDFSSPKKKRCRLTIQVNSSPISGFDAVKYNTAGLYTFLHRCEEKYKDCEFTEVLEKLQDQKVGIDLLGSITAAELQGVCGVTWGTAFRIIKSYPKWHSL